MALTLKVHKKLSKLIKLEDDLMSKLISRRRIPEQDIRTKYCVGICQKKCDYSIIPYNELCGKYHYFYDLHNEIKE